MVEEYKGRLTAQGWHGLTWLVRLESRCTMYYFYGANPAFIHWKHHQWKSGPHKNYWIFLWHLWSTT